MGLGREVDQMIGRDEGVRGQWGYRDASWIWRLWGLILSSSWQGLECDDGSERVINEYEYLLSPTLAQSDAQKHAYALTWYKAFEILAIRIW